MSLNDLFGKNNDPYNFENSLWSDRKISERDEEN